MGAARRLLDPGPAPAFHQLGGGSSHVTTVQRSTTGTPTDGPGFGSRAAARAGGKWVGDRVEAVRGMDRTTMALECGSTGTTALAPPLGGLQLPSLQLLLGAA